MQQKKYNVLFTFLSFVAEFYYWDVYYWEKEGGPMAESWAGKFDESLCPWHAPTCLPAILTSNVNFT